MPINTANYVRNRCPTKSLNGLTPYEVWYGHPPDVSYFQQFGCKMFCLNNNLGKGKLDSRSKEGIFLGYSDQTKGFRMWLKNEQQVIICRDVKLLESSKPYKEELESFTTDKFYDFPGNESEKLDVTLLPSTDKEGNIPENDADDERQVENQAERKNVMDEINKRKIVEDEGNEDKNGDEHYKLARGRGRPKLVRSGGRGRPKNVYTQTQHAREVDLVEEAFVGDVSMKKALSGSETKQLYDAISEKYASIIKNNTWTLVDRLVHQEVLGSRIVLRNKYNADGSFEKRKTCRVAQGFK